MTVQANIVTCATGQWTEIARGAASAMGFRFSARGNALLLPTGSASAPAALSNSTPAWPVSSNRENNFATDTGTYWWIWNPGPVDFSVIVWKL